MKRVKNMTVKQLEEACAKHKYLLLHNRSGQSVAVNTKIAPLAMKRKAYISQQQTAFVSYMPCDLNTYINKKVPFIS